MKRAIGGAVHPICRKKYGLDGLWTFASYDSVIKKGIHKIKYSLVRNLNQTLTDLVIEYWAINIPFFFDDIRQNKNSWRLVPVPLHKNRRSFRGFNQSALVAAKLGTALNIEVEDLLIRYKNTRSQVGLERRNRLRNIKNAFAIKTSRGVTGLNFLLIDDVWTTGATIKECCYLLKRSGANKVWAVTLAR